MERRSWTGLGLPVGLVLISSLSLAFAAARVVQVPTGTLPADVAKFVDTPVALFLHALAGLSFGLLGPLQFFTAFRRRFGTLHRASGGVFLLAGVFMGLSGLSLLADFWAPLDVMDVTRAVFGTALVVAVWVALDRIRRGDIDGHRAWVIRAYAIGMGTAPLSLVLAPIFIVTGVPPEGALVDTLFVGVWVATIAVGEFAIARSRRKRPLPSTDRTRGQRLPQRPA